MVALDAPTSCHKSRVRPTKTDLEAEGAGDVIGAAPLLCSACGDAASIAAARPRPPRPPREGRIQRDGEHPPRALAEPRRFRAHRSRRGRRSLDGRSRLDGVLHGLIGNQSVSLWNGDGGEWSVATDSSAGTDAEESSVSFGGILPSQILPMRILPTKASPRRPTPSPPLPRAGPTSCCGVRLRPRRPDGGGAGTVPDQWAYEGHQPTVVGHARERREPTRLSPRVGKRSRRRHYVRGLWVSRATPARATSSGSSGRLALGPITSSTSAPAPALDDNGGGGIRVQVQTTTLNNGDNDQYWPLDRYVERQPSPRQRDVRDRRELGIRARRPRRRGRGDPRSMGLRGQ